MIAIDLHRQQAPDADYKAIPKFNFTGNLEQYATIFQIIKEAKKTGFHYSDVISKAL